MKSSRSCRGLLQRGKRERRGTFLQEDDERVQKRGWSSVVRKKRKKKTMKKE
jgi:hypothetical protein